ncbi:SLC12A9 family protein [Megaselia abdita]
MLFLGFFVGVVIMISAERIDNRSTNTIGSDVGPETPITSSNNSVLRSFGSLFRGTNSRSESPSDGYVEFGMAGPERNGRTLGTFAGVFSPVALSMFSALVFIRVGKILSRSSLEV